MNTDLALADSGRETSGSSRSTSSETDEWEPVVEGAETGHATTNWDKSPRINSPWTLSPRVVYHNLRAGRSFSNLLLHPDSEMITTSTAPLQDARSPSSTRQAILGFMGRRARSATTGTPPAVNPTSPSPPLASPNLPTDAALGLSPNQNQSTSHLHLHLPSLHRHSPATDDAPSTAARLGGILRRRRSNGGDLSPLETPAPTTPAAAAQPAISSSRTHTDSASNTPREATAAGTGPSHRLRLVPHLDPQARTLHFEPIVREVKAGGPVLRIGRFTERVVTASRQPDSTKIAFKSKVVSRAHAEIWCAPSGKFMIRDTRSSSGTFLNHTRLSAPNIESRPTELHDGDIVQLGVDYQGGAEEIYRCVKIRVEVGREWQREANEFNTGALKQLQTLQGRGTDSGKEKAKDKPRTSTPSVIAGPSNSRKTSVADCCICLFPVGILQSLFIAPCSHCFHYKCIRPLLIKHHPGFSCPLCRTFADLEEDVEQEYAPSVHAPSVHAPSVHAPSVRAPSIYAASVHEAEAVVGLIEAAVAANAPRECVDVCVGTSPEHGTKDLPPVPGDEASGSMTRQSTLDTGSDRLRPESTHSGPPHNSDGGSTPRGSSEDLRAAQRGLFDSTLVSDEPEDELVRVPGGIIVPRSPDREHDIFNSATPLNNQFLTLTALNGVGSGLPSIPSVGDIPALRHTSEYESSVDLATPYRAQDTESAKHILVDDEEDDNDKEDDDALVIDSMKRMSVATETEAGPSSQVKKI
ncbi:E3 ubiquitin-protein ligase DMA2 [Rhizoctonia solani]|uniref:E3 ubiquitin-protein ligase DMA2 n=1 Tax=Rhizoctonia solani TaxID=456999 RepID=A0A8H8SYH3_9AGAM|nr:E3 ubiquitin-protein ligase DMA2 [Rhizoctonia solani]QRW22499.1 E3 ubiquitin-protein ligase DMA2 [Rhizoctonia solani]